MCVDVEIDARKSQELLIRMLLNKAGKAIKNWG